MSHRRARRKKPLAAMYARWNKTADGDAVVVAVP
jgi:hypothetical protein